MPTVPQHFLVAARWRGGWFVSVMGLVSVVWIVTAGAAQIEEKPPSKQGLDIDITTLRHKVLCGYQSGFRCPDDPAK